MKKQVLVALLGAAAMVGSYNISVAVANPNMCTLEHCQNLMSVRAYNKNLCKKKDECLKWLATNAICSPKQLVRCKKRDQEGLDAVPDLRTDGMDY